MCDKTLRVTKKNSAGLRTVQLSTNSGLAAPSHETRATALPNLSWVTVYLHCP